MNAANSASGQEGQPISLHAAGSHASALIIGNLRTFASATAQLLADPEAFRLSRGGAAQELIDQAKAAADQTGPNLQAIMERVTPQGRAFLNQAQPKAGMCTADDTRLADVSAELFDGWLSGDAKPDADTVKKGREIADGDLMRPFKTANERCDRLIIAGHTSLRKGSKTVADYCRTLLSGEGETAFANITAFGRKGMIERATARQKLLFLLQTLEVYDVQHVQTEEPQRPASDADWEEFIMKCLDTSLPHEDEEVDRWNAKLGPAEQTKWNPLVRMFGRARALARKIAPQLSS